MFQETAALKTDAQRRSWKISGLCEAGLFGGDFETIDLEKGDPLAPF